ncbi:MAG TPA: hypothetical protein VJ772_06415 [Nitrososphaeraceae archaeon]|nr:hypothetical protein [Nitrososphaeraceae archaeon]
MSKASNDIHFLDFLKRSEPIGLLASLSLVVATFTYGNLEEHPEFLPIYNFSVTSSFMFLISFLFSLFYQASIKSNLVERYVKNFFFSLLFQFHMFLKFGTYFFLGFGIILLLLVMFEFGKLQPSIFVVFPFLGLFFFGYFVFAMWFINLKNKSNQKKKFDLVNYGSLIIFVAYSLYAAAKVGESLYAVTGIGQFVFSILINIISPIAFVIIIIHFIGNVLEVVKNNPERRIASSKASKVYLILNIAVVLIFSSILVYIFTAGNLPNTIAQIRLNITSTQGAIDTANTVNQNESVDDDILPRKPYNDFSRYI